VRFLVGRASRLPVGANVRERPRLAHWAGAMGSAAPVGHRTRD
jgi:hypothetical protein